MRGRILAVTGLGSVAGMLLWSLGSMGSLTGAASVLAFVFLCAIVVSAVYEVYGQCRRRQGRRRRR